jgi:DTW domain-containing protein
MQVEQPVQGWRERCYECFRPVDRCFCSHIPSIENRTNVLIFQHMRERFHPFNTARILRKALLNSNMIVDHIEGLSKILSETPFTKETGLLYPGHGSQLLEDLPDHERPKQLVILDGTWHHTKTLFRDIPQLQALRKVRLAPTEPSRYGIRREPDVLFLSTLEATVAALRFLEPDTIDFEKLLAAFEFMVANQMAHPKSADSVRRKRRPRALLNIPKILRNDLANLVVVYGETGPGLDDVANEGADRTRTPVLWVAERLGSSERFERIITPCRQPSPSFFKHLEIPEDTFSSAISMEAFRLEWESFLKPTDTLAYYFANCANLLDVIGSSLHRRIYLKSIQLHRGQKNGTIEELLTALNVDFGKSSGLGRAHRRLESTIALARYLNKCSLLPKISVAKVVETFGSFD